MKSLKIVFVAGILIFSGVALSAGPKMEPSEFKTPPAGTLLHYKILKTDETHSLVAREPDGKNQYSWFTMSGTKKSVYPFCNWCLVPHIEIEYEKYAKLFPLEKGKKVKFKRESKDGKHSWTITIKVKKTELLETPISKEPVETYVIVEKVRHHQSNATFTRTFWWSPEYAVNLKIKDHDRSDKRKLTYELSKYVPPQDRETLPTLDAANLDKLLSVPSENIDSADFKTPPLGTRIQYKNMDTNVTYIISPLEPVGDYQYSFFFTETGDRHSEYNFCSFCASNDAQIDLEEYARLFPLVVGKKIELQRTNTKNKSKSWTHTIEVKRTEMLNTTFSDTPIRTFVVEDSIVNNKTDWHGKRTVWWSPQLGNNLKAEKFNFNNKGQKSTYEVINYILPP